MLWLIIASAVIGYIYITVKMNRHYEKETELWMRKEYPESRYPHMYS